VAVQQDSLTPNLRLGRGEKQTLRNSVIQEMSQDGPGSGVHLRSTPHSSMDGSHSNNFSENLWICQLSSHILPPCTVGYGQSA
jgi:hypothetical protein